jgi:hypothetical protein
LGTILGGGFGEKEFTSNELARADIGKMINGGNWLDQFVEQVPQPQSDLQFLAICSVTGK